MHLRHSHPFLVLLCLLSFCALNAQQQVRRCHTMEADAALRERYPQLGTLEAFENWLAPRRRAYEQSGAQRSVITIPIVFHIIHNGEPIGTGDNISAAYVNAQIQQLNNDFRRILGSSGYNDDPAGADSEIEFCAATVDPGGNALAEPGIHRINRNAVGWSAPPYGSCIGDNFGDAYIENTIKPQSQWDPNQYLNVWVMDLSCDILGYAQFPSTSGLGGLGSNGGPAATDGVVLRTTTLGSTDLPFPGGGVYNQGRTGTHEVGHFFGLRHIWGDQTCGTDFCADTPQAEGPASGCPNATTCDGIRDMVENYMDYSFDACMNIFTSDQKARMQTVLLNSPRRGILANSTACSAGSSGPACAAVITNFPYSESFESGFGDWIQAGADDFDWIRNSGGTPSGNTGPAGAADGSWYVFVEASSPNYPAKAGLLNGPCFDLAAAGSATFSFRYHLFGAAGMGSLALQANASGSWSTIWTAAGNQGNSWQIASVDLSTYLDQTVQLRFLGTTGDTWQGDMAIDNLQLAITTGEPGNPEVCADAINTFPYAESWESDFGAWSQSAGDNFDWIRATGSTPSSGTGPIAAADGSWYAYVESSSPNYANLSAVLNGPCYDLSAAAEATFSFQYHLYGAAAMGSLILEARRPGDNWSVLWSRSGNQGNAWQTAGIPLADFLGGSVELRFVGVTGTTWQGDMAIDDLQLTTGATDPGTCTDVTLSITFDNYPEETSWQITDAAGNVAYSGGPYTNQADRSTINLSGCIPDGCYTFTIFDTYGDGMCCAYGNGSYTFTDSNGTVLAAGNSFGSSESTGFCLPANTRQLGQVSRRQEREFLQIFPNPARDLVQIIYESKEAAEVRWRLADPLGRTVKAADWRVEPGENRQYLQVDELAPGAYLLIIEQGGASRVKRMVIAR